MRRHWSRSMRLVHKVIPKTWGQRTEGDGLTLMLFEVCIGEWWRLVFAVGDWMATLKGCLWPRVYYPILRPAKCPPSSYIRRAQLIMAAVQTIPSSLLKLSYT